MPRIGEIERPQCDWSKTHLRGLDRDMYIQEMVTVQLFWPTLMVVQALQFNSGINLMYYQRGQSAFYLIARM